MNERFQVWAEHVSELAGGWQHFFFWAVAVIVWTALGPTVYHAGSSFLPAWFTSNAYSFTLNSVTTLVELFLGLLILAAANRVQRRQDQMLEHIQELLEFLRGRVDEDLQREEKIEEEVEALQKDQGTR